MLPGYNHNVQYKGRIYHIQTEDSGVQNPHIITLLYYGGNIIARKKTSYEDILNNEKLNQVVKEMMQEQHKAMLRDLKNGVFDDRIKMLLEPTAEPTAQIKPTPPPPPRTPPAQPATMPKAASSQIQPSPSAGGRGPATPPKPATLPPTPQVRAEKIATRPSTTQQARPPVTSQSISHTSPIPSTSKLIELSDDIELKDEDIFGADLISDKSLDEVILSYLAQNLEEE